MTDTTWITEGVTVAEYGYRDRTAQASFTTVERLTATQIVCANGNRYRRDSGLLVGAGRGELRPVDDRSVRDAVALATIERLRYPLDRLFRDLQGNEAAMLAILDRVDQLVAEARAMIADPTRND